MRGGQFMEIPLCHHEGKKPKTIRGIRFVLFPCENKGEDLLLGSKVFFIIRLSASRNFFLQWFGGGGRWNASKRCHSQ